MKTVRRVLETICKPFPQHVKGCFLGVHDDSTYGLLFTPCVHYNDGEYEDLLYWNEFEGRWEEEDAFFNASNCQGPDISDRPAEDFFGFFGSEFDNEI